MTQPHMPPGWPPTHPRQHDGPGPALAGLMLVGFAGSVLLAVGAVVGVIALLLWIGGNW